MRYSVLVILLIALSGCFSKDSPDPGVLRLLLEGRVATLNPRRAIDANGERITELLFTGLIKKNADLDLVPDLAEKWSYDRAQKKWTFSINKDAKDHLGTPITAEDMAVCLKHYILDPDASFMAKSFPGLQKVEAKGNHLFIHLSKPDPFILRNLSLVHFFRTKNGRICSDPQPGDYIVTSGAFHTGQPWITELTPDTGLDLHPLIASPIFRIRFFRDEATASLLLLRGDADVVSNSLTLPREDYFKKHPHFNVLVRNGQSVDYLAFNSQKGPCKDPKLRRAISYAIDREHFIRNKGFGFITPANSLLPLSVPELRDFNHPYSPEDADKLLDELGYHKNSEGVRLSLVYKTTNAAAAQDRAMVLKDMLRKSGIHLKIESVEIAVFFSAIKSGRYDVYGSRWVGVQDATILYTAAHSGSDRNRVFYKNPETDRLIDKLLSEDDPSKRKTLGAEIQKNLHDDRPYLPLWYWNNVVVVRKGWKGLKSQDLSLSGGFMPLTRLTWQP